MRELLMSIRHVNILEFYLREASNPFTEHVHPLKCQIRLEEEVIEERMKELKHQVEFMPMN